MGIHLQIFGTKYCETALFLQKTPKKTFTRSSGNPVGDSGPDTCGTFRQDVHVHNKRRYPPTTFILHTYTCRLQKSKIKNLDFIRENY